jgi:hypothetical protein
MQNDKWHLKPGDRIERKDLQAEYGGRTQGGIGPSKSSPNVLLFTDPVSGEKHGYIDGWQSDGCFHYTGEGQRGDQQMKSGNASIMRHREEGRALRLFLGARGTVTYDGEYEIDPDLPYYTTDAPETGGGPVRSVIVFRLRPKDVPAKPVAGRPILLSADQVEEVPIEAHLTEKTVVEPDREPYEAERREAKLVTDFRDHLRTLGHTVLRLRVTPAGEAKPLYTDLYVPSLNLLVEAKGTVERGSVRMALGQLFDYRRFVAGAHCAVLLPSRPREDLLRLVSSVGIDLYWKEGTTFHHEPSLEGARCLVPAG